MGRSFVVEHKGVVQAVDRARSALIVRLIDGPLLKNVPEPEDLVLGLDDIVIVPVVDDLPFGDNVRTIRLG